MVANSLVLKRDVSSAEEFRVIVMRNERKKKRRVTIEESLMLISEEGAEILQDCVVINDSFHPFFSILFHLSLSTFWRSWRKLGWAFFTRSLESNSQADWPRHSKEKCCFYHRIPMEWMMGSNSKLCSSGALSSFLISPGTIMIWGFDTSGARFLFRAASCGDHRVLQISRREKNQQKLHFREF